MTFNSWEFHSLLHLTILLLCDSIALLLVEGCHHHIDMKWQSAWSKLGGQGGADSNGNDKISILNWRFLSRQFFMIIIGQCFFTRSAIFFWSALILYMGLTNKCHLLARLLKAVIPQEQFSISPQHCFLHGFLCVCLRWPCKNHHGKIFNPTILILAKILFVITIQHISSSSFSCPFLM